MQTELQKIIFNCFTGCILACLLNSCGKDDGVENKEDLLTGDSFSLPVLAFASADTIGEVSFFKHTSGATTITIEIEDLPVFSSSIAEQSGLQNGPLTAALSESEQGVSSTYLTELPSGNSATYDGLSMFDGHIRIEDNAGEDVGFADLGPNSLTEEQKVYPIYPRSNPAASGSATFCKRADNSTLAVLRLSGVEPSANHPTHIHVNTAVESGVIAIDLAYLKGNTATSLTHVERMNDGNAITYDDLLEFNGYINVHRSDSDISTLIAQSDIGRNAFTGREISYDLGSITNDNVSGRIMFQEREDNTTLASFLLTGTEAGKIYPAHIHENSAAETGVIVLDFNDINGSTKNGFTNVRQYNDGRAITYEELLSIDGHVNVHDGATDAIISQCDAGQNVLTGEQIIYPINETNGSGINGELRLFERKNGFTLAVVELSGSLAANNYSAIIYAGDQTSTPAEQLVILKTVSKNTGISSTTVRRQQNGDEFTYNAFLSSDAHLRILENILNPDSPVAIASIGSNASARSLGRGSAAGVQKPQFTLDAAISRCN